MGEKKDNLPISFNERPLGEFLRSIDNFFKESFRNFQFIGGFPVRQYETNENYIIEAHLAGVKKEQINIFVFNNHLKISVENLQIVNTVDDKNKYYEQAKTQQKIERVVILPFLITESEIKASHQDGILKIIIPNKKKKVKIE